MFLIISSRSRLVARRNEGTELLAPTPAILWAGVSLVPGSVIRPNSGGTETQGGAFVLLKHYKYLQRITNGSMAPLRLQVYSSLPTG